LRFVAVHGELHLNHGHVEKSLPVFFIVSLFRPAHALVSVEPTIFNGDCDFHDAVPQSTHHFRTIQCDRRLQVPAKLGTARNFILGGSFAILGAVGRAELTRV
jgi:hypothetical protein